MVILQIVALGVRLCVLRRVVCGVFRDNWINILRNNAAVGIIALGMTFVIISGGIDLAVGSTLVAVGAVVMMVVDGSATGLLAGMGITGVPAYIIAIAVGLVFGALLGWLNGVLIAHGKLPPFIATLGTMQIFRSVTQQLMQTAPTHRAQGAFCRSPSEHRRRDHPAHPLLARAGGDPATWSSQAYGLWPPRVRRGLQRSAPHASPA